MAIRTVTANDDIREGQTVVVDKRSKSATPARGGTRKLSPDDPHVLATALANIRKGQTGDVQEIGVRDRVAERAHHGNLTMFIDRLNDGRGDMFVYSSNSASINENQLISGTIPDAQIEADSRRADHGHKCTDVCGKWTTFA